MAGIGFDPKATNAVQIGGKAADVVSVTATNVEFLVSPGTPSGLVVLTVNGQAFTNAEPFTVMRVVSGRLSLPPGVHPDGYRVSAGDDLATPSTNDFAFAVAVPVDDLACVWAFRSTNDPAFLTVIDPSMNEAVIAASSTAVGLTFLSPLLTTHDPTRAHAILTNLAGLPAAASLANVINTLSADGRGYLDDARFANAATNALTAILALQTQAASAGLQDFKAGTPTGTWLKDLNHGFLATPQRLDSTILDVDAQHPGDYRLRLATPSGKTNPLDWIVEVYQLAAGQFSQGRASVDALTYSSTPLKLDAEPVQMGFVHASLGASKADPLGRAVGALFDYLFPANKFELAHNEFPFAHDLPGVYVSQAYSGNLWYGTGFFQAGNANQTGLLSALDADDSWDAALAANLAVSAIDMASTLVSVKKFSANRTVWDTIILETDLSILNAIKRQHAQSGVTRQFVYDVVRAATTSFVKNAVKAQVKAWSENAARAFLQCLSAMADSVFNVTGKISAAGQSVERLGGLVLPNALAIERSVAVIGNPFYPQITSFDPRQGRAGDIVVIRGYNFPDDPSQARVSFCAYQGTTTDPETPPSVKMPARILAGTNTVITIQVPDGWQTNFPDHTAFLGIESTQPGSPVISSATLADPCRQFRFSPTAQILDVEPKPVRSEGVLHILGTNFLAEATFNNQVFVDGSLPATVQNSAAGDIVVVLPRLPDGTHQLTVRINQDTSDPFPFTVRTPAFDSSGYQAGLTIRVSLLDFSNTADGKISLLEACLLAQGGEAALGRPLERHLPCESLAPSDPNYCPPQTREIDWIPGYYERPVGALTRDTIVIVVPSSNVVVRGVLPVPGKGDTLQLGNLILDGGGVAQDGWVLDGAQGVTLANVTFRNYAGNGVRFRNGALGNALQQVVIQDCTGDGVLFDEQSQNNSALNVRVIGAGGNGVRFNNATGNSAEGLAITNCAADGVRFEGAAQNNHLLSTRVSGAGKSGLHMTGTQAEFNYVELPGIFTTNLLGLYERCGNYGVLFDDGAQYNTVDPGTVRSNALGGIRVLASWNVVGRNWDGILRLYDVYSNGGPGAYLGPGVHHTVVHFLNPAGNQGDAVLLEGPDCSTNQVESIYTGVDIFSKGSYPAPFASPNAGSGIHLVNGAHHNLIGSRIPGSYAGRGAVAGNRDDGVLLEGANTAYNTVNRMHVGSLGPLLGWERPSGFIANGGNGIHLRDGAHDNVLGDAESWLDLHIMASRDAGILIEGIGTDNNRIVGNQIGGNHEDGPIADNGRNRIGIHLKNGVRGTVIGEPGRFIDCFVGHTEWVFRFGNVIANCTEAGIVLDNCGGSPDFRGGLTGANVVENNRIGEQDFGLASPNEVGIQIIHRADGNRIGGPRLEQGNRIANNNAAGIAVANFATTSDSWRNRFENNLVINTGAFAPGGPVAPLVAPPDGVGLLITNSVGAVFGENFATANTLLSNSVGVYLEASDNCQVRGNRITSNQLAGVVIHNGRTNTVGGLAFGSGNRISANGSGQAQQGGVLISGGGQNELASDGIGAPGAGNLGVGVLITNSAANCIGGNTVAAGNVISGNQSHGLQISGSGSAGNQIVNNSIGVDWKGRPAPNRGDGVRLDYGAVDNQIGGLGTMVDLENLSMFPMPNTISNNGGNGVSVVGSNTLGNSILYNQITANTGLGIATVTGGNHELPPPLQVYFDGFTMIGQVADLNQVPVGSWVQVFSDPGVVAPEGAQFLGEGPVLTGGTWIVDTLTPPACPFLTMTATHQADGSTSEFGTATAVNYGLSLSRVGSDTPGTAGVGSPSVVVLNLALTALNADARVNSMTLTVSGLPGAGALAAVSVVCDRNLDGTAGSGDPLLVGPVPVPADTNQLTLNLTNAVIPANSIQHWLVITSIKSTAAPNGDFQVGLTNAAAVAAQLVLPVAVPITPAGTFPIASARFTIKAAIPTGPVLAPSGLLSGRGFQINFSGVAGQTCTVQCSTDLSTWIDLSTLVLTHDGPNSFLDPASTNLSHRFYRATFP